MSDSGIDLNDVQCGTITCQELVNDLYAVYYSKLVSIAAYALLIYEYIITFRREEDLIWSWNTFAWGKMLYLFQRYFTIAAMTFIIAVEFIDNLSTEMFVSACILFRNHPILTMWLFFRCISWTKFHWFAGCLIVMLAELTLQLRLYAMYGKTKRILIFLLFTFFTTFGIILMFIGRLIAAQTAEFFNPIPGNSLFICVPINVPNYFRDVWIPLFVHEVVLMALAVYKGLQVAREHGKAGYMGRFAIFLVKDSVLYYFSVFGAFFSLELVWAIGGVNYIELPFGLVVVIGSIMSQRLLLKIRERFATHNSVRATMRRTMVDDIESSNGSDSFVLHTFLKV